MRKNVLLLLCILVFTNKNANSQTPDSLTLNNGQTMMGMFYGWQKGVASFYMLDVGMVNVNMDKISSIIGNLKEYRVVTSDRKVYYGGLKAIEDRFVRVSSGDSLILIPYDNIVSIVPYNKKTIKPLASYIAAGYSYSKSSNVGVLNLDLGFNYSLKHVNVYGVVNSMVTHDNKSYMRNREYALVNSFVPLSPKWEIGSRFMYQRNRLLGLDARYLAAGGLEFDAIVKQKVQMYLFSGLVMTDESLTDNSHYNRLEVPFLLDLQLYSFSSSVFTITTTQIVYFGLFDENRIRHDGELKLNCKINNKLSINTYLYDNYDSSVKPSNQNIDYGWVVGLRYDM
jgi:hypothetical protein